MIDLSSISKTKRARAPKIVIAGPGKIGKTTFAAMAPASVGILTEDGSDAVDAQAFPLAKSYGDVRAALNVLLCEDHQFRTVWIDSLDWLEPLIYAHVCAENKWANIEAPGYGKGYAAAGDEWRALLNQLEQLRSARGMGVILIAHDKVKKYDNPQGESYDTYALKLHDRAAALVTEWADVIGWAAHETYVRQADAGFGAKEAKAVGTGRRVLHVEPSPTHMGGNRFGLRNMDLNFNVFVEQLASAQK